MTLSEILLIVAAWCGNPLPGQYGVYEAHREKVNTCRQELLECIQPLIKNNLNGRVYWCVGKRKL